MKTYINLIIFAIINIFIYSCEKKDEKNNINYEIENIKNNFSTADNLLTFENISYENIIIAKNTLEITTKFYEKLIKLKNKHNIDEDYYPILNSYSAKNNSILFISMEDNTIVKINLDNNEELSDFDNFFTLIQDNIVKLKNYYNIWAENIFYKSLKSEDITIAINLDKINKIIKNFNNNALLKFIYSHYYIGLNFYDFYEIDKKNLSIQLHKIIDDENNELLTFTNALDSYLNQNLNNTRNFYNNFLNTLNTNNLSTTEKYTLQSNYDLEKKFSGIKNLLIKNTDNSNLSSTLNKLIENVSNFHIDYNLEKIYSDSFENDSLFHADKINNFVSSHENIGKNNEYYKFIEFSEAIFHYNNLSHNKGIFNGKEFLYPALTVPIKQIDLRDNTKINIEYGDNFLYDTENWNEYGGLFYKTPKLIHTAYATNDKLKSFSLLKALNLDRKKEFVYYPNKPILLPTIPEAYISYTYENIPGILYNENKKLNNLRNIQRSNKFKFMYEFYDWRFYQYAIKSLDYEYIPTEIEIKLGNSSYILVTPYISDSLENKINYKFFGDGGNYFLKISNKAEYQIESTKEDKWFIDATDIPGEVYLFGNIMAIGKKIITFNINEKPEEIIVLQSNGILRNVNFSLKKNHIAMINYEKQVKDEEINFIKKMSEYNNQYEGYIEIENYISTNNKAWYDIMQNNIINPLSNECCNYKNNLIIIGNNRYEVYFYNTKTKDILYLKKGLLDKERENSLQLIESNVSSFIFSADKLFIKNHTNIIMTVTHSKDIKIISYDNSLMDIEHLKSYAKNKNYNLEQRLMVFNAKKELIGWYLSQENEFFAKDNSIKK